MNDDGTVLLVFFGLFAVLTAPMAGGNLWRLADVRLRSQWLVGVALTALAPHFRLESVLKRSSMNGPMKEEISEAARTKEWR